MNDVTSVCEVGSGSLADVSWFETAGWGEQFMPLTDRVTALLVIGWDCLQTMRVSGDLNFPFTAHRLASHNPQYRFGIMSSSDSAFHGRMQVVLTTYRCLVVHHWPN